PAEDIDRVLGVEFLAGRHVPDGPTRVPRQAKLSDLPVVVWADERLTAMTRPDRVVDHGTKELATGPGLVAERLADAPQGVPDPGPGRVLDRPFRQRDPQE